MNWLFKNKKSTPTKATDSSPVTPIAPNISDVVSSELKIEDIACTIIKGNSGESNLKNESMSVEEEKELQPSPSGLLEESFTKSDNTDILNTTIDSVDLASTSIDQEKGKLEHAQRCTTIEEKLEWIEAQFKQSSPNIDEVTNMLHGIINRLEEQESYLDGGDKFNSKVVNDFLSTFSTLSNGKCRSTIIQWLRKVRPINIAQLLQFINETETAAKVLEDQDVVMFLGTSQSGKSTTIHFLTGSKFSFSGNALHIMESSKYVDVENVKTGFNMKSTTRFINPVKITAEALNNLGVVPGSYSSNGIILCDAPGFGDTQGAEMDISNGIGITRALQKCHSVKFMFVCSDQVGDTGNVFKGIIQTVGSMFYSIDDHLGAFSYIFTKWNDSSLIYDKLAAIRDTVIEKEPPESPLYMISEHMVQSIEDKIYLVKPCDGDPAEILNMVLSKTARIENTLATFKDFVSTESLLKLTEYCHMVEKAIPMALAHREVNVMRIKMEQLCEINTKVKTDKGVQAQQQCIEAICGHLDMLQSCFDEICNRICDSSAASVSIDDRNSLVTCCEEAIDLSTILQFVGRESLTPQFATRVEKLTMNFCQSFRSTFSLLSDSEFLHTTTAESEHISVFNLSNASALRDKVYCISQALSSSDILSGSEMKETIEFTTKQYELMESSLALRFQFFTEFLVSENVHSDLIPNLLQILDYMAGVKSLLFYFPRINPAYNLCLEETSATLVGRFRKIEEDVCAICSEDAQEIYRMDVNHLQRIVERLGILSSLANNSRINILTTEHANTIRQCVAVCSKSLHMLSITLMSFLTSLLPNLDSMQVIAFAEVNKMTTVLAFCDMSAARDFTVSYNRYMASCSQHICDSLKSLDSNELATIDIETVKAAIINLSTAFEESEAKQYLTHTLEVFRDIVHRLKEYIISVSFDSVSYTVFMRLYKIIQIEKFPLFGFEGSQDPDLEELKSSIAAEIKDVRHLYDTGISTVEKLVLRVLSTEKILEFDFKTIADALLIVPHLQHGITASYYVQTFRTFIQQKLPTSWAEIKCSFDLSSSKVEVEDDESTKNRLKSASMDWAHTINKLVSLHEQFSASSYSFPPECNEAVELFDVLPAKLVSASISEALSFLAEFQLLVSTHSLIVTEGRRWVDQISTCVTMWLDPILSNGSLLNAYNTSNEDGFSFRMLSDLITERLRVLVKDLKSEILVAASGKRWLEVSHMFKTRKDDLSTSDLDEVTTDLTKVIQEDIKALLASTEVYSSSKFPQIFEESLQRLQNIKIIHSELSLSLDIADASIVAACESSFQNLIQSRIDDSFDSLVEKKSFRLLEENILSLEDIMSKLVSLNMPCHNCEQQYSDYNSYLSQNIALKNKQIDDLLLDVINFISEQDISQYCQCPPADVIDEMKACENLRNNQYQSRYLELKEWILDQYACLLYIDANRVVSIPVGISFEKYEEQYRLAEDSRAYIPRDFFAEVNSLCILSEKFITEQKNSLELERISCEMQDLSDYIAVFKRHCSQSNFSNAKIIKANLEKVLVSQIKVIVDRLQEKDFIHAIDHFSIFSKHLMLFDKTLGDLKEHLVNTTTRIYPIDTEQRYFHNGRNVTFYYVVIDGIPHRFQNLTPEEKRTMKYHHTNVYSEGRAEQLQLYSHSEVTRKGLELVERMKELFINSVSTLATGNRFDLSLQIVVKFLRSASNSNVETSHIKKTISLQEEKIKSSLEKLNQVINGLSLEVENILKDGSSVVVNVKRLLDTCKENENGFIVWDDFVASTDYRPYLSASVSDTKKLRYKELQHRILESFRALLDETMKVHYLLHPECTTPNETDRTRFYEKVNWSYQSIQNIDLLVDHLGLSIQELHEMKKSIRDHISSELQKIVDHLKQLKDSCLWRT